MYQSLQLDVLHKMVPLCVKVMCHDKSSPCLKPLVLFKRFGEVFSYFGTKSCIVSSITAKIWFLIELSKMTYRRTIYIDSKMVFTSSSFVIRMLSSNFEQAKMTVQTY